MWGHLIFLKQISSIIPVLDMFPISSGDQELQIVVIICIEIQSLDVKIMLIMRCKCPISSAG